MVNGYKALYKQKSTFFAGIDEIAAGSVAIFGAGRTETRRRFWQPDLTRRDETMSYADAVAETRAALIRSVELRLRADVPLAFCLSAASIPTPSSPSPSASSAMTSTASPS